MPRDPSPASPQEWINRAKSNLAIARQPRQADIYREDLCFEAQQAAEKALKAVLLSKGVKFRRVHDLSELLTALEEAGIEVPDAVKASAILTDYSVEARYPGPYEPVTEEELQESLTIAEAVVAWAEGLI
jgi:HEPN domain-containing protein